MALTPASLPDLLDHDFDSVIDVRSPSEFAEDHLPGAVNMPVLDDAERAEVGTIYVQQSPFLARKRGAALVFANIARHVEAHLQDRPKGWRPLVYCWRGGQRSGAFHWALGQIGWRGEVLQGGYRTYRRLVNGLLYQQPLPQPVVVLDGNTGTAKTDILKRLAGMGEQVLDLEGLAAHRGSLLGAMDEPQPSQKGLESRIAAQLVRMDPTRPLLVEAESSKIGDRLIPPMLWEAMKTAPRIEISAPIDARTAYLTRAYDDILSDAGRMRTQLARLKAARGAAVIDHWFALIAAGDKPALTRALIEQHYDPAYARSRAAQEGRIVARVTAAGLDAAGIDAAAQDVAAAVAELSQRSAAATG